MIIHGSINHSFSGRKRKTFTPTRKKAKEFIPMDHAVVPNDAYLKWQEDMKKYKSAGFVPTDMAGRTPKDDAYKQEVSKNYTVSIAFNKGAYQVISNQDIKHIGK